MSALSNGTAKSLADTIARIHKTHGAALSDTGFYMSPEKMVGYAEQCFKFWDFSSQINIVSVDDRDGYSFLNVLGAPVSSRTDVRSFDRAANSLLSMDTMPYKVEQVNTDVSVSYSLLNQWQESSRKFATQYLDHMMRRVGIDRLIIGWHGQASAANTDPVKDPTLSDVATGWMAAMSNYAPSRILGGGADIIKVGGEKPVVANELANVYHFNNLDHAVLACVSMIPQQHREGLVCLVGSALLEDEMARVYSSDSFIFDKHKNPDLFNSFGNLPRVECQGFPASGLVVTSPKNLSIYMKRGTAYRQIQNNVQREWVGDYQTCEMAYVVENPNAFFAFNPYCLVSDELDGLPLDERTRLLSGVNAYQARKNS